MPKYEGIPETLTLKAARQFVEPRVSEKRFAHIEGVAKFAKKIAEAAGVDPFLAELSGWLHDACKSKTKSWWQWLRDLACHCIQLKDSKVV